MTTPRWEQPPVTVEDPSDGTDEVLDAATVATPWRQPPLPVVVEEAAPAPAPAPVAPPRQRPGTQSTAQQKVGGGLAPGRLLLGLIVLLVFLVEASDILVATGRRGCSSPAWVSSRWPPRCGSGRASCGATAPERDAPDPIGHGAGPPRAPAPGSGRAVGGGADDRGRGGPVFGIGLLMVVIGLVSTNALVRRTKADAIARGKQQQPPPTLGPGRADRKRPRRDS